MQQQLLPPSHAHSATCHLPSPTRSAASHATPLPPLYTHTLHFWPLGVHLLEKAENPCDIGMKHWAPGFLFSSRAE